MANNRSLEHTIREARIRAAMQYIVEEVELDEVIMNSNSCGQGHDPEHSNHPFHSTILKHGYSYSHSTPVKQKDGATINYHTYKHHANRDKNVSVVKPPGMQQHRWDTSTSGSGRQATQGWHSGTLDRHLKSRKIKPLVNHTDLKEEVEVVDELSKATLGSYVKKAAKALPSKEMEVDGIYNTITGRSDDKGNKKIRADIDKREKKIANHYKGIDRATDRLTKEEVEVVDEIGNHKLEKYVYRASSEHGMANFAKRNTDGAEKQYYARKEKNRKQGISTAIKKLDKKFNSEEVEIVDELAPAAPNPMQQKMAQQRAQIAKQKDAFRMQLMQQKAARQEQAMKERGQKSLEKIKEDEALDERILVNTFGRASKLEKLHSRQYNRLSAGGELAKAELHRKKAAEYKRIMYTARKEGLPAI